MSDLSVLKRAECQSVKIPGLDDLPHQQTTTTSRELMLSFMEMHCVRVYPHTVHSTHTSQVTICSHDTDNVLYELYVSTFNQMCNFSQVLTVAP